MKKHTRNDLMAPYNFGDPVTVDRIVSYLTSFDAVNLTWFKNVTVLSHIANVAMFSAKIAEKAAENGASVDVHKAWIMGWLRDVGRVPWGIASKAGYSDITQEYGHHGYLGYEFLLRSGVPEDLAIISMTHIGSGISAQEVKQVNQILERSIFPEHDWFAKTPEEKIVVIADKVPGWNNTVVAHHKANQRGERKGNKIYSWLENQNPLWERFWKFKEDVDDMCGCDVLSLFDSGLLNSYEDAYDALPKPDSISQMSF